MNEEKLNMLLAELSDIDIKCDFAMSNITSFKTGGAATLCVPKDADETLKVLEYAKKHGIDTIMLGNCTNVLVSDEGTDALIVKFGENMSDVAFDDCYVRCGAGALISVAAKESVKRGLAGLEWAAGIPGSVGGAMAMNAGAYGGEVADVVNSVEYIENGQILSEKCVKDDFSYRKSPYGAPQRIVTSVVFKLNKDDNGGAKARMDEFNKRRREKQPIAYPSAGSFFKRPQGAFAGALIENAGLKGKRVGGACVSELHAGFIINLGGATSRDVYELMMIVRNQVERESGFVLEPEVKFIGRF